MSGGASASFVYDGDGVRIKGTVGGTTTIYVGEHYEKTGSGVSKYYYANGQRVAVRRSGYGSDNNLFWLLTDHLGSTAVTLWPGGAKKAELRYKAFGENRYTSNSTPTTYRYTGQREESAIGLYFYRGRWYDAALGRFVQADTIVPDPVNPQALNRFSYVLNNPVRYTDPTGHAPGIPGQSIAGALAIALEVFDPLPLDPVVIPFGLALIANDPLWQVYGPQVPALIDKAGETGRAIRRALEGGGNTADPGGLDPNNVGRLFRDLAEQYQYQTSGTLRGEEPTLRVVVRGAERTVSPDSIVGNYLHESKFMNMGSDFYSRQIGNVTGLELHVSGWKDQIERLSFAAAQHAYSGVKVFVTSEEARVVAMRMYSGFGNVEFFVQQLAQ